MALDYDVISKATLLGTQTNHDNSMRFKGAIEGIKRAR
jgi:hypothetical protein